jgi:F0F1-type ATP synthase delta subunit
MNIFQTPFPLNDEEKKAWEAKIRTELNLSIETFEVNSSLILGFKFITSDKTYDRSLQYMIQKNLILINKNL